MKNGLSKTNCLILLGGLVIGAFLSFSVFGTKPAKAATGVNQTINFQGRLLNSQGATVPDGFYNIEFKIYQDGDGQSAGDTTGSPSGSLKWTEDHLNSASHGVKVVNGYMSVQLGSVTAFGSNVNWNQDTLWLSMNVGNTSSCTITTNFTSNCSGDGEMLPMQPMTSSPYALNSGQLGGLTSSQFIQLAQGIQTDNSTAVALGINKTGASGNILELQKGGVDVMNVSNTGTVLFQPTADSATALQVKNHANSYSVFSVDTSGNAVVLGQASSLTGKLQFATAGGGTLTINPTSSASSFTITLPAETGTVCTTAASGVCNTAGGLSNVAYLNQTQSFTGTNTFAPTTNISSEVVKQTSSASPTADIFNVQGTNGTSNFIQVTSTAANQGALNLQSFGSNDVTLNSGSGSVKFGTGTSALQFTNSGTATVDATSGQELDLGTAANAHTTKVGSATGASTTTIQSGTGGVNINPDGGSNTGVLVKPVNASTAGFQVQNASSNSVFSVDTSGNQILLGKVSSLTGKLAFATVGGGTLTINPTSSASSFTITLPAETGTVCTTAAAGVCNTAGGLTNVAYLNQNQTFTGTNTFAPTTNIGGVVIKQTSAASPTADIFDVQGTNGTSNFIQVTSTAANQGALNLQSFGSNDITLNSGSGSVKLGTGTTALQFTNSGTASVDATSGQELDLGAAANAHTTKVGSASGAATTTVQSGTGGLNLNPNGGSNTGVLVKPVNDSTAAFQIQNSSSNQVLTADTSANEIVLGKNATLGGALRFQTAGAGSILINTGSTGTGYTLTLPTTGPSPGQCLQSDSVTASQLKFGACGATGTFLIKNATDTSSAAGGSGYLYGFTSTGSSTGGVLSLNNSTNTGSTLSATTAGNPASGKAVIYGENTNASPSGNLFDLESGSTPTSKFSVNAAGNVTAAGTYNTNTFTGSSLIFGSASTASLQAAASQALTITGNASSTWSVGGTNQNLTIQTSGTGTLALDTVGAGTVNLGTGNATTIGIGNNSTTTITIGGSTSTGTITTRAQGITHTITGSATTPTDIIKTGTDNSGAFQVQNHSSQSVFSVDTSANKAVLGLASNIDGTLLFQNHANGNGITINSTGANTSYTLTLPAQAPSGGLCIQTSTGTASQLVFASCANNNTSISEVAAWDANNTSTLSISPSGVGDEVVLTTQIPSSGVTVSSISGGGITNWNKVTVSAGNGTVNRVELWVGTVSTVGSSNVTITYSASPGANEITATEFTAAGVNQSTSWGIESFNNQLNSSASTTVTYPSLTAVNGAELYYGYAQVQNAPATAGSTTGFSYIQTSTQHNMITYNPSLTANTAYQPTATQNSSGQSNTVSAILTAFVTSTAINNSTSLQKANFYVQAANAGSVAGVLQSASSGTGDILNLRNSSATNVVTVSSAGNVLIKPAASATAFQVQNGSSYGVLTVDTSGNSVVLGDATHLSGSITFKDSGDSNTISITAPSSIATSYTLALPSNTPTAGLCLATSPSNANQLIFSSCATQVSAASISYVTKWDNHGTSVTTISDSPSNLGDLLVFYSHTANAVNVNSISGGGVTTWYKVTAYQGGGTPGNIEMWRGVVTTTGSGTITATYSATAGTNEIVAEEFTMGSANGTWAIDTSGTATTTSSVTTVNYPSLTPLNSNELYTGYAYGGGTMSTGSTSGFTYVATGATKYLAYKTNASGGTAYAPTAPQTSGVYASIAAVVEAYTGTSVIVNTTSVQDANFYVQAATSGTVAGILQAASSGSADVFQVQDSSGNNVMSVNATSGTGFGLTLGTSNVSSGQLIFNASGNSNSITIVAPSAPGSSYSLTLPTTTPAAGQCLATSPSNANQLVFSSCANQVTSVAISFVSSWKTNTGASPATLSVSPANVGDLMVLFVSFQKADSVNGAGVSGGGCGSAWSKVAATGSGSGTDTTSIEMYRCQVTSTGSSNISVSWSGPAGTHELAAMEFTTGSTTGSWVVDSSNTQFNSSSTTTATWPSLTPQSSKDLYVGYAADNTSFSGTVSSGFTYVSGSLTNRAGLYNTSVSSTTQPTATITSSASLTVGALVAAYSSSSVISNSTVTQQANFNVQAATSGSVAGTLQAFPTGTGDILDLLDGSSNLVDKFDYVGDLLIKPSTASASAFQVQTTGAVNVLSADTSAKQVVVGAGSTGESSVSLLVVDSRTGSSADPTEVNGAMYYNATTHEFRCGVAGAWQNCSGLISSNTSQSSANNNCSNNCVAFSTSASIPANYCQAGRVIRLNAHGYFSSQGSATNLQFGVYYGTDSSTASNDTLIGTLTPAVSVTSASNNYFGLDFDVTCFSTTSMQADGLANIQIGSAAAGVTGVPISSTSATTVVSTSAKNLYIFPVWGATSASDTAKITQFIVSSP